MARKKPEIDADQKSLPKCPTGIAGLDAVTNGGLPRGRPTLVCGEAGCGKTLLAMEFLVRGAAMGEPGVFVSFEERPEDLIQNVESLHFDAAKLVAENKLAFEYVYVERSEIEETGEYDLEALFIRLAAAIEAVGAKRIALDTLEALFAGLGNEGILRAELRRLFRWLKEKGLTAVITAESGEKTLTRHGMEEYVSDCVIVLDHRLVNQMATRRLRVVKYRGSAHQTNEYPFLIDDAGFSVLPVTSLGLDYAVSSERVTTGLPRLDTMLGGGGYYRGSSVLVSGTSGTGKSSMAGFFVDSTCRRGERALYFAFEESPDQIMRNMRSIGLDLKKWVDKGLLHFQAARPTLYGMETHLTALYKAIRDYQPTCVVVDPITSFLHTSDAIETNAILLRLIGLAKSEQITTMFTSLTPGGSVAESTQIGVSSLMDTWIGIAVLEANGERNRLMWVLKSRGMANSNQVREFLISDDGIELADVYIGAGTVLTGSARVAQAAREKAEAEALSNELARKKRDLESERAVTEAKIAALQARFTARELEFQQFAEQDRLREAAAADERDKLAALRRADAPTSKRGGRKPK